MNRDTKQIVAASSAEREPREAAGRGGGYGTPTRLPRWGPRAPRQTKKVVIVVAVMVVLGALGGGFYFIGPPAEERARRLDERRVADLQRLRFATDLYWTRNRRLPETLDALHKEAGTNIYARDPASGEQYEYEVKGSDVYELCAAFARESEGRGDFWSHGAGRQCFEITAKNITP